MRDEKTPSGSLPVAFMRGDMIETPCYSLLTARQLCCVNAAHPLGVSSRFGSSPPHPIKTITRAMCPLNLEIFTKQRVLLQAQTPWVTLPGTKGQLGILPSHAPLVTTLTSGVVRYQEENDIVRQAVVHHGYAQVDADSVRVLVEVGEKAEEVDTARARQAQQRATEMLDHISKDKQRDKQTLDKWGSKLLRATERLNVSQPAAK